MKKKAYREELEAQINAKKEKARAEKEADRRPVMQPARPTIAALPNLPAASPSYAAAPHPVVPPAATL